MNIELGVAISGRCEVVDCSRAAFAVYSSRNYVEKAVSWSESV